MNRLLSLSLFLATLTTLLAGTSNLRAGTAGIHDNAGFFSDGAKADASSNITDLQKRVKKDVCVETFAEIPADLRQGLNLQDKAAVNRVCEQWALKRAKELTVNGVYMLLVKQPPHLQVEVGNDTQRQAFTLADRDRLVNTMLAKLRAKDNDGALREGVSYVAASMRG
ncbi:MAG: TPM domain-containing protein, partial [Verrucomicrobiaceae bacterium]